MNRTRPAASRISRISCLPNRRNPLTRFGSGSSQRTRPGARRAARGHLARWEGGQTGPHGHGTCIVRRTRTEPPGASSGVVRPANSLPQRKRGVGRSDTECHEDGGIRLCGLGALDNLRARLRLLLSPVSSCPDRFRPTVKVSTNATYPHTRAGTAPRTAAETDVPPASAIAAHLPTRSSPGLITHSPSLRRPAAPPRCEVGRRPPRRVQGAHGPWALHDRNSLRGRPRCSL